MNREVLDRACERGILGLVLVTLVFGPLAMGAVETPYFLVIQGLTLAVMFLWGLRLWLAPRPQLLWPPICWAVLAFVAYAIVRYRTAEIEYVARLEMIRVLVYTFLFFVILNNLHRQEHVQIVTLTLVFLAMAISFYALYQFITGSDKVWTLTKPYVHRGSGTYISPNHLAGFLEIILPLALAWILVSRGKALMKVFVGYASLVILGGIAATVSRGSWISIGLTLIVFFSVLFFHRTHRLPAIALLVVIGIAALYLVPRAHLLKARFQATIANPELSDNARFDLWKPALQLWQENIWWGIGPNHFNYRFRAYRPETVQLQPDRVHNDYLNTLCDWGIAGTALAAAAWVLLYAGVLKTWRMVRRAPGDLGNRQSNKAAFVLGASMGLLAILFHSVVDFNMHIPANAILTIALMAMLSGALRFATDKYWWSARFATKAGVTLLLLAGLGYLGWQGVRRGLEYAWLERAHRVPGATPRQVADLEKAFAVEPMNFETADTIGQILRVQYWDSDDEAVALAAIKWFERGMKLDPYDNYSYMLCGMCLDRLGKTNEARPYFDRSVQLDPNGYFTVAQMGWHYVQTGDYAAARTWFERSKRLQGRDNTMADSYLGIINRRMLEAAAEPGATLLKSGGK